MLLLIAANISSLLCVNEPGTDRDAAECVGPGVVCILSCAQSAGPSEFAAGIMVAVGASDNCAERAVECVGREGSDGALSR